MKSKALMILLVLLGILVLAAFTSPDADSYKEYITRSSGRQQGVLNALAEGAGNLQELALYEYDEYLFFSRVSTYRGTEEKNYLGLFGLWIPLP
jgi:Tfp pilus assembly protein PilE